MKTLIYTIVSIVLFSCGKREYIEPVSSMKPTNNVKSDTLIASHQDTVKNNIDTLVHVNNNSSHVNTPMSNENMTSDEINQYYTYQCYQANAKGYSAPGTTEHIEAVLSGEFPDKLNQNYHIYWKVEKVIDPLTGKEIDLFMNDSSYMNRKYYFRLFFPSRKVETYGIYQDPSIPVITWNGKYVNDCGNIINFFEYNSHIITVDHYVVSVTQSEIVWLIEYNTQEFSSDPETTHVAKVHFKYHIQNTSI